MLVQVYHNKNTKKVKNTKKWQLFNNLIMNTLEYVLITSYRECNTSKQLEYYRSRPFYGLFQRFNLQAATRTYSCIKYPLLNYPIDQSVPRILGTMNKHDDNTSESWLFPYLKSQLRTP